ncbi:hypothetical protein K443DRAFT_11057 [Laccaria amethystina LaAM-08-1]|uniref:Unplaced genomic scaffold K443scaffold_205, whole genome shotgun sequence n=1 Tax=Laccaria amethystina LaAM-08-1 TaxID=1095629 RepID=A0A0C9X3Q7_9AGAR|nr:hypothetical protein K443DRAFT_11057 [Laccaria amethystina LaAM-08-1]
MSSSRHNPNQNEMPLSPVKRPNRHLKALNDLPVVIHALRLSLSVGQDEVSTLPLLASTSLASPISTTPWTSSQRLQTPTRSTRHALRHPSKTAITSEDGNVGSGKSLLLRGLRADTAVRRPTWVHRSSPLPDTLTWSSSWGFMVLHKAVHICIYHSLARHSHILSPLSCMSADYNQRLITQRRISRSLSPVAYGATQSHPVPT